MNKYKQVLIAIADGHVIMRKGVTHLINTHFGDEFQVILEASDGKELLSSLEKAAVMPDVCLLDLNMKGMSGFETLVPLKKKWPEIKVLIFTNFASDYSFLRVLKGGANGILSKSCDPKDLKEAIRQLTCSGFYYSDKLPLDILKSFRNNDFSVPRITPQEKRFLSLCCTELSYKQIAAEMSVGIRTVDGYRVNLFAKLGVTSRAGLIMFVIKSGIVSLC